MNKVNCVLVSYPVMKADPTVKINYMLQEGYVCSDNFTDLDAAVVCKQTGNSFGQAFKASAQGIALNIPHNCHTVQSCLRNVINMAFSMCMIFVL